MVVIGKIYCYHFLCNNNFSSKRAVDAEIISEVNDLGDNRVDQILNENFLIVKEKIQGDFTQEGNACSFAASGNNMVILSGGKAQNIYFDNPESSYFSGIDVSGSAGVQCNYTRNIDISSIIANLTGLPIDDVINDLNNLSIVDFNSVLNTIANKYINAKNLQYLVEKDIGYVVLGLLKSADDNLFWGAEQTIYKVLGFNTTLPEDNFYYMLGKTAGDAIFLAAFLKVASKTDVNAAESLYAACAMAIGGLVLVWTGAGFVVCESVALEELVEAVGTAVISVVAACVVGGFVSHSTDLLKSDAEKLSEIKDEETQNWKSVKEYGHTFNTHGSGAKNTKSLTDRARSTGNNQGQWLDNQKAAEYLKSLGDIKEPTTVSIPEGIGQVITPTGEIVPATKAIVVPSATGIKTAYPIP